jgi:tRNA G10  N-methylase Trm11
MTQFMTESVNTNGPAPSFLYTYTSHEDEEPLCRLELNSLFGQKLRNHYVLSQIDVDPSRSPFIKLQIAIIYTGDSLLEIAAAAVMLELQGETFKVMYVVTDTSIDYNEQRAVERELGSKIRGKAEMRRPDRLFGIAQVEGRWLFGECSKNKAVWLKHNSKPQHYSTALSTRMARAVANIAVPFPSGIKAIDPCCGIGTVLVEALSMDIDIVGCDINPLAVKGARTNLEHFGLPDVVTVRDMRTLAGSYDVAILDLPYNLCSVISPDEKLSMLESLRRLTGKAVVITTDGIDPLVERAGFMIIDRCLVKKGTFSRQVLVCN